MQWPIYTSSVIPPLQDIDWHRLLARPPLQSPAPDLLTQLACQPILITGAGGSIGSALAQRLAALHPPAFLKWPANPSSSLAPAVPSAPPSRIAWLLSTRPT